MQNNIHAPLRLHDMLERAGKSRAVGDVNLMPPRPARGGKQAAAWLAAVDGDDAVIAAKLNAQRGAEKARGSGNNDHLLIHGRACTHREHVSLEMPFYYILSDAC
jgi:hypothetical protein